jgi:hypothetical protein
MPTEGLFYKQSTQKRRKIFNKICRTLMFSEQAAAYRNLLITSPLHSPAVSCETLPTAPNI